MSLIVLFFIAGFLMEALICVYHRSREHNHFFIAASLSGVISLIGILVISKIIALLHTAATSSIFYVFIFAFGKTMGNYMTLRWWHRKMQKRKNYTIPSSDST